jgi:hypothetical protein
MSWEWEETSHPCPCGQGTYTIAHGSDDWGQSEERTTMNCPKCAEIYVWTNLTPGRPELRAHHGWVRKTSS